MPPYSPADDPYCDDAFDSPPVSDEDITDSVHPPSMPPTPLPYAGISIPSAKRLPQARSSSHDSLLNGANLDPLDNPSQYSDLDNNERDRRNTDYDTREKTVDRSFSRQKTFTSRIGELSRLTYNPDNSKYDDDSKYEDDAKYEDDFDDADDFHSEASYTPDRQLSDVDEMRSHVESTLPRRQEGSPEMQEAQTKDANNSHSGNAGSMLSIQRLQNGSVLSLATKPNNRRLGSRNHTNLSRTYNYACNIYIL